ncbi:MAG: hypothetical protein VKQ33_09725 [Candidatus Sericytochromatia bacterium]|nr:hypothetical protein [Candidatus Sericytochromatia bacterium]
MHRLVRGIALPAAALVLGCQGGLPPVTPGTGSLGAVRGPQSRLPGPAQVATTHATASGAGGAVVGDRGVGVVSNNGARQQAPRLFGTLRVPAPLISDQGGALGGLAASGPTTALYRVSQGAGVIQVPLADAEVRVLDAAGQPVRDEAGQPLVARTDAAGSFRFETPLPDRSLVVSASLAAGRGALLAVAARDSRHTALEVDLFSTLTTAYIVEKFVATQADRQQTLDRLPGDVAQETRQQAEAAFREAGAQLPQSLDAPAAVAAAEALRQEMAAFDRQLEAVRELLILAGQSNRGEGRLATTVALGVVGELAEGPDGSLYFPDFDPTGHRLMRVHPDGRLVTLVGGGQLAPAEADGRPGAQVAEFQDAWCLDEAGRVLVAMEDHLYRLQEDGTLRRLRSLPSGVLVGVRREEVFLVDWHYPRSEPGGALRPDGIIVTLWRASADREPVRLASFTSTAGLNLGVVALVPGKGLLVEVPAIKGPPDIRIVDPDSGVVSRLEVPDDASWSRLDRAGNLVYVTGAVGQQQLWAWPQGAATPLAFGAWSGKLLPDVLLARDGQSVWLTRGDHVVRVTAGGQTLVAGLAPGAQAGGGARDLALADPGGLAFSTDAAMWLLDNRAQFGTWRLVRVEPAGQVHQVPVTEPALEERLIRNLDTVLRPWGPGSVALLTGRSLTAGVTHGAASVHEVRQDGTSTALFTAPAGYAIADFSARPDGSLRAMLVAREAPHRLVERTPDGAVRTLFEAAMTWEDGLSRAGVPTRTARHDPDLRDCNLLEAPGGEAYVYGQARLARWSPGAGFEVLGLDPALNRLRRTGVAAAVGPDGALYYLPGEVEVDAATGSTTSTPWGEVWRWDPRTNADACVAGPRGGTFTGQGIDDGLYLPRDLAFTPEGDLTFIESGSRQVRRIPRDQLGGIPMPRPDDG